MSNDRAREAVRSSVEAIRVLGSELIQYVEQWSLDDDEILLKLKGISTLAAECMTDYARERRG